MLFVSGRIVKLPTQESVSYSTPNLAYNSLCQCRAIATIAALAVLIIIFSSAIVGGSLEHGPQIGADRAAARPVPKLPQRAGVGGRSARHPGASPGLWACQAGNEYPIETALNYSSTRCGLLQA
jgi:hypothetical protein